MPIYEYQCSGCQQSFEELVFSRDEKPECPHCGSFAVEKKISTFGVGASTGPCGDAACPMPEAPACGTGACPNCE